MHLHPVSIHAPARGATDALLSISGDIASFNSRARKGRDKMLLPSPPMMWCFNSRARKGRDDYSLRTWFGRRTVSIHAPARGATIRNGRQICIISSFNSRARKGRDATKRGHYRRQEGFNSRARKGRDYSIMSHKPAKAGFNSRARKGRDGGLILSWIMSP